MKSFRSFTVKLQDTYGDVALTQIITLAIVVGVIPAIMPWLVTVPNFEDLTVRQGQLLELPSGRGPVYGLREQDGQTIRLSCSVLPLLTWSCILKARIERGILLHSFSGAEVTVWTSKAILTENEVAQITADKTVLISYQEKVQASRLAKCAGFAWGILTTCTVIAYFCDFWKANRKCSTVLLTMGGIIFAVVIRALI